VEHFTAAARSRFSLPIRITAEDLDEVERSHDLIERVRERFEWTLDLDPRYRVLALEVARLSFGDPEVRAHGITAPALREVVQDRWPDGFEGLTGDEFRVLLGEMVDLEVFAAAGGDRFRLPTSNVLRLLGDEERIEEQLIELIESIEEPSEYTPSRLRRSLTENSPLKLSPLSLGNEATILAKPTGEAAAVRVVLGTAAHAIDDLYKGLEAAAAESPTSYVMAELDVAALERHAGSSDRPDDRRIFVVQVEAEDPVEELRRVAGAAEGLSQDCVVVPVVDQRAAGKWLDLVDAIELAGEDDSLRNCELIELRPWDQAQLDTWIEYLEVPASNELRRRLHELTGGWASVLVDIGSEWFGSNHVTLQQSVDELEKDPARLAPLVSQLGVDHIGGAPEVFSELRDVSAATAREIAELLEWSMIDATESIQSLRMVGALRVDGDDRFMLDSVFSRALEANA